MAQTANRDNNSITRCYSIKIIQRFRLLSLQSHRSLILSLTNSSDIQSVWTTNIYPQLIILETASKHFWVLSWKFTRGWIFPWQDSAGLDFTDIVRAIASAAEMEVFRKDRLCRLYTTLHTHITALTSSGHGPRT